MDFSMQVGKKALQEALKENGSTKNVASSPLSISVLLSILAAGSKGKTLDQLLEFLEYESVEKLNDASLSSKALLTGLDGKDGGPHIAFANAVWVDHRVSLQEPFQLALRNVHNIQPRVVDFINQKYQVIREANLWTVEQTKGLIKEILTEDMIDRNTTMISANALYFKATWVETFNPKLTEESDFHLLDGGKVRAPFMRQWNQNYQYGTFEDICKVLKIPYRQGERLAKGGEKPRSFSMYIFLPDEIDGLPSLMEKIKIDEKFFNEQVKFSLEKVNLSIPKFKFECHYSLPKIMKQLGLTLPFEANCECMIETPMGVPVYTSDFFQKCAVEVNEKGTEASVVTRSRIVSTCYVPPKKFVANHPFMFAIREDISKVVLFIGAVVNPL